MSEQATALVRQLALWGIVGHRQFAAAVEAVDQALTEARQAVTGGKG